MFAREKLKLRFEKVQRKWIEKELNAAKNLKELQSEETEVRLQEKICIRNIIMKHISVFNHLQKFLNRKTKNSWEVYYNNESSWSITLSFPSSFPISTHLWIKFLKSTLHLIPDNGKLLNLFLLFQLGKKRKMENF